jgi:hypothetical protein
MHVRGDVNAERLPAGQFRQCYPEILELVEPIRTELGRK